MADWGDYNPTTFMGFPDTDLAVDPETRHQFALALYGIPEAFAALKQKDHFWAMSVPMRVVFGMMPTRYPHFYSGQRANGTVLAAPVITTPVTPMPTGPTFFTAAPTTPSTVSAPESIPQSPNTLLPGNVAGLVIRSATGRGASKRKRANTFVGFGADLNHDLSLDFEAPPTAAPGTHPSKTKTRSGTKKTRRHASMPFEQAPAFALHNDNDSDELREEVSKAKTWYMAFKLALHGLFSLAELRAHTAKYTDQARLKLATELVSDFCQERGQPQPTNAQFHTAFSHIRLSQS